MGPGGAISPAPEQPEVDPTQPSARVLVTSSIQVQIYEAFRIDIYEERRR
jgi:hypothetical protein